MRTQKQMKSAMEACSEKEKEKEIKETIADLFLKLNGHLNSHQSGTSGDCDRGHITLDGNNVGAATIINRSHTEGESGLHFCINIYVNNNVQGVNNSILLGSKVTMRDPGVHLSLPLHHKIDEKRRKRRKTTWPVDCRYGVTLFCINSLLLMLFFFLE